MNMDRTERKEHGLLYKAEMVRAILRDVDPKTQTRRPVTFYNSTTDGIISKKEWPNLRWEEATLGSEVIEGKIIPYWTVPIYDITVRISPRIRPGDLIWGRETFMNLETNPICGAGSEKYEGLKYWYKADNSGDMEVSGKWTPSILMHRWASRLELDVLSVRSQRIQEISEEDAHAEGINEFFHETVDGQDGYFDVQWGKKRLQTDTPSEAFMALWDSINVARGFSWDDNHPVWINEFKRIKEVKSA